MMEEKGFILYTGVGLDIEVLIPAVGLRGCTGRFS